tara:strand:- start:1080 stop:1409 length:330 start_codon:yes stop_codon:yes gene_type:complete
MTRISDVYVSKDDLGKKVYRKVTQYTIEIAQDVVADSEEEAEQKFLDGGGIEYDEIKSSITSEFQGVETSYIDCNYLQGEIAEVIGEVGFDPDDEFAKEEGYVEVVPVQ